MYYCLYSTGFAQYDSLQHVIDALGLAHFIKPWHILFSIQPLSDLSRETVDDFIAEALHNQSCGGKARFRALQLVIDEQGLEGKISASDLLASGMESAELTPDNVNMYIKAAEANRKMAGT